MPDYFSNAVRIEDFSDLAISGFEGRQAQNTSGAAVSLHNGSGVSITNSRALPGTLTFLELDKVTGRRVFANYDVMEASKIIVPADQKFEVQLGPPNKKKLH
jgi:hypothetical protein